MAVEPHRVVLMERAEVSWSACLCICTDRIRHLHLRSFWKVETAVVAGEARLVISGRMRSLRLLRRGIGRRLLELVVLEGEEAVFRGLVVLGQSQAVEEEQ